MKTVKIILAIWIAAAVIAGLFGNITIAGELGSTTAGFLKVGAGARAQGIGEAFTSIADNSSAIYWNAAGLRRLDASQAEFSHQSWYQDVNIEHLMVAFPGQKVSFGAGLTYLNFGEVKSYDVYGEPGDDLSMYNLAITIGAATDITENVSLGLSAKYIEQSFDIVKGSAWAGDIGIMARFAGINFGAAATNIGTKMKFIDSKEKLPAAARFGLSFRQLNDRALFSVEGRVPFEGLFSMHQGVELQIHDQLAARTGLIYKSGTAEEENALSYNLGLGVVYGAGRFDYTFIPSDDYGSDAVHNFSISLVW